MENRNVGYILLPVILGSVAVVGLGLFLLIGAIVSDLKVSNKPTDSQEVTMSEEVEIEETQCSVEQNESDMVQSIYDVELLPALEPTTTIRQEYVDICVRVGEQYGMKPELLVAMIETESDGQQYEVSNSGAIGLMQIIPKYHKDRMRRLGTENIYDAWDNIEIGCDFIAELYSQEQDMAIALIVYNCGRNSRQYRNAVSNGKITAYATKILERCAELEMVGLRGTK